MKKSSEDLLDIAIIGGGIAGAGIARDATLRGFRVGLFEKNTFGSGTSGKSSKLIHGGLRYLEIACLALRYGNFSKFWKNFCFVFSALRESHILERTASQYVKPILFIVPLYQSDDRSLLSVYIGSLVYGILAFLSGSQRMPKILWSKDAVLKWVPNLNAAGLVGGVVIWDHLTNDKELVQAIINDAERSGAEIYEHAPVQKYQLLENKTTYKLTVKLKGKQTEFYARKVINAGGPWIDQIRSTSSTNDEEYIVPVAGAHINVRKFTDYSVILRAPDKRIFFVINIGPHARIGTTERIHKDPDHVEPLAEEIEYLFFALERYFPSVSLSETDVIAQDAGIRPLARPKKTTPLSDISREHEIRTDELGVIHMVGVKITDHRRAAQEVVDQLVKQLTPMGPSIRKKRLTPSTPLG
jgi:glycerol-3-phosphate dehydrogenase